MKLCSRQIALDGHVWRSGQDNDGSEIIGVYDAELIRDAVECVGKHPICYIGYNKNKQRPYPFFLVGSDDSLWNISSGIHAIVMPLAKHSI